MKSNLHLIFLLILSAALPFACGDAGDDDDSAGDDDSGDDDSADDDDDDSSSNPFLDPGNPGPYLVGNTSYILEDFGRRHGCGQGNRRLVTEVWYPACDDADQWPENYFSDFFLDKFDEAVEALIEAGYVEEEEFVDFPTGSYRDAPPHPDAAPMPILVFSHGFSSNRFQNYTMSNYLASHGYAVVSADHTCNAMFAALPEGVVLFEPLNAPFTLEERKGDVSFLIDEFTLRTPETFAGRLDADHVGFWGHSFGGLTVTEQIKTDFRVSAMIQLASFGFPPVPEQVVASAMFMYGQQDKIMEPFKDFHDQIVEQMPPPKYELNFFDTGHFAFSDLCVYSESLARDGDGCGEGTRIGTGEPFQNPDHDVIHEVLNAYAAAFFGATFFGFNELAEYLGENRFPEMMVYQPVF